MSKYIEDTRQQAKVRHTLKDILVIVLFATLANADDWVEMALKKNQYTLYEDVKEYFMNEEFQKEMREKGGYRRTEEKAHGQIEIREYYQTEDIRWLSQKKTWKGHWSIESMHWHLDVTFREDANTTIDKVAAQKSRIGIK